MKRLGILLVSGVLIAGLCACGGKEPFDPEGTTRALLETEGVFSEELEELEEPILLRLYGLEDRGDLTAAKGYGSTGATAEEVSVFAFADAEAAQEAMETLEDRLACQRESNQDYRPQEMPKLDKAVLERRGETLLFLVCADYDAARKVLG